MFQNPVFIVPRASLLVIPGREKEPEVLENLVPLYIEPPEAERIKNL
jgi:hypothetical protein